MQRHLRRRPPHTGEHEGNLDDAADRVDDLLRLGSPHPPSCALVPPLHLAYGTMQPWLAPVNMFFVATLWTVAIYFVPLWRSQTGTIDPCVCGALLLSIAY